MPSSTVLPIPDAVPSPPRQLGFISTLERPSVIDLFAGCGGLSLGLEQAGFIPVYVNELDPHALESYRQNRMHLPTGPGFYDQFHSRSIKELTADDGSTLQRLKTALQEKWNIENGQVDLVVGGPPCQGFSGIGYRRSYAVEKRQLPSNHLFQDMAYVVAQLRPKIFLFSVCDYLINSDDGIDTQRRRLEDQSGLC